jgi:hypothetical protein
MNGIFEMFDAIVIEALDITKEEFEAFDKVATPNELKFVILAALEDRKIDRAKVVLQRYNII